MYPIGKMNILAESSDVANRDSSPTSETTKRIDPSDFRADSNWRPTTYAKTESDKVQIRLFASSIGMSSPH